jgi:hypothetical protein
VIGRRPDPLVEACIEVRVADRVSLLNALAHLDDHLAQVAQVAGCGASRRAAGQHRFERGPHLLDLQRLAIGDEPDSRTSVRLEGHEAFLV